MISLQDFDKILDRSTDVVDQNGDKIGDVGQLYVNDSTGQPSFVTVRTGLFGNRETFVPLDEASFDGENLVVPFTSDQVKDAPQVDEGGSITAEDEETIYNFYGVQGVGGLEPGHAGGQLREGDHLGEGRVGRDHLDDRIGDDRVSGHDGLDNDPGLKQDHDALKAGAEGGVLDRDWQDSDGDGKRFERVDHDHDPETDTFEDGPRLDDPAARGVEDDRIVGHEREGGFYDQDLGVDEHDERRMGGGSDERLIGREGGEQLGDVDTGLEAERRQQDHEVAEDMFAGTQQRGRLRRYERVQATEGVMPEDELVVGDEANPGEEQGLGPEGQLRR